MPESLLEKAQRLNIQPTATGTPGARENLAQKAARVKREPQVGIESPLKTSPALFPARTDVRFEGGLGGAAKVGGQALLEGGKAVANLPGSYKRLFVDPILQNIFGVGGEGIVGETAGLVREEGLVGGAKLFGRGLGEVAKTVGKTVAEGAKTAVRELRKDPLEAVGKGAEIAHRTIVDEPATLIPLLATKGAGKLFEKPLEAVKGAGRVVGKGAKEIGKIAGKGAVETAKFTGRETGVTGAAVKTGEAIKKAAVKATQIDEPLEKVLSPAQSIPKAAKGNIPQATLKKLEAVQPEKRAKLDWYLKKAEQSVRDPSKSSALELASRKAEVAVEKIQKKIKKWGEEKRIATEAVKDVKIEGVTELRKKMLDTIRERTGTGITKEGNVVPIKGRTSVISDPNDMKILTQVDSKLKELMVDSSFKKVDDTIDFLQDMLYKRKQPGLVPVNSRVEGVVKQIVGELNGKLRSAGGGTYRKANQKLSKFIQMRGDLNKMFGLHNTKGGAIMKRIFSPSDAGTKRIFKNVQKATKVDLIEEAVLAKFAMETVGDPRHLSLLQEIGTITGKIDKSFTTKMLEFALRRSGFTEKELLIEKARTVAGPAKFTADTTRKIGKEPLFQPGGVLEGAVEKGKEFLATPKGGLSLGDITKGKPTPETLAGSFKKNAIDQLVVRKNADAIRKISGIKTSGIKTFDDLKAAVEKTGLADNPDVSNWLKSAEMLFNEYIPRKGAGTDSKVFLKGEKGLFQGSAPTVKSMAKNMDGTDAGIMERFINAARKTKNADHLQAGQKLADQMQIPARYSAGTNAQLARYFETILDTRYKRVK